MDIIKKDEIIDLADLTPLTVEIEGVTVELFYKDENNNIFSVANDLTRFAGYQQPRNKTSKILKEDEEIYEGLSRRVKKSTPSGTQETRILVNEGIHLFIMELRIKNPQAKLLKLAYAAIVEKYRRGELIPVPPPPTSLAEVNETIINLTRLVHSLALNQALTINEMSNIKDVSMEMQESLLDMTIDNIKQADIDVLQEQYVKKKCLEHEDYTLNAKKAFYKSFSYRLNEYLSCSYNIKQKGHKSPRQLITNRIYDEVITWIQEKLVGSLYKNLKDFWEEEE